MTVLAGKVTVICGPPAAGKTSYVREHSRPGDLIVDLDTILAALTGLPAYDKPAPLLMFAEGAVRTVINLIEIEHHKIQHAWVIRTGAQVSDRQRLKQKLQARVVVLETLAAECCRRIDADARRPREVKDRQKQLVAQWWQEYRPTDGDERIPG